MTAARRAAGAGRSTPAPRPAGARPAPVRPDPRRLAAWTDLLLGHSRVMALLERELRRAHGMSLSEYDVLHHLARAPGRRLRMRELSEALLYTTSGTTRLLDRVARDGLVRREPSATDRRVVCARLTDDGLDRFREAAATHLAGVQRHFAALLPDGELGAVQAFTRRLARPGGAGDRQ